MDYVETPEKDRELSDKVYDVDPTVKIGLGETRPEKNKELNIKTRQGERAYNVVDVSKPDNSGFQAMAVAPKSKGGVVDMKHITIAYSGTNVKSIGDVATDGTDVLGGVDVTGQWNDAKKFADQIHAKYPKAKISVTGHSLGGFLAFESLNHWSTSRLLVNEGF